MDWQQMQFADYISGQPIRGRRGSDLFAENYTPTCPPGEGGEEEESAQAILSAMRSHWEKAMRHDTSDDDVLNDELTAWLTDCYERCCVGRGAASIPLTSLLHSWDLEKVIQPRLLAIGIRCEVCPDDPSLLLLRHMLLPRHEGALLRVKKEVILKTITQPASHLNSTLRLEMTTQFKSPLMVLEPGAATGRWVQFVSRYGGHAMCRPVLFALYRAVLLQKKLGIGVHQTVVRWRVDNYILSLTAGSHFTRDLMLVLASMGMVPYPAAAAWDYQTHRGAERDQAFLFRQCATDAFLRSLLGVMTNTNATLTKCVDDEIIVGKLDYVEVPAGASEGENWWADEDVVAPHEEARADNASKYPCCLMS